jgi:hypothetical protein
MPEVAPLPPTPRITERPKPVPTTITLEMLAHSVDRQLQLPEFPPLTLEDVMAEGSEADSSLAAVTGDMASRFSEAYHRHCQALLEDART